MQHALPDGPAPAERAVRARVERDVVGAVVKVAVRALFTAPRSVSLSVTSRDDEKSGRQTYTPFVAVVAVSAFAPSTFSTSRVTFSPHAVSNAIGSSARAYRVPVRVSSGRCVATPNAPNTAQAATIAAIIFFISLSLSISIPAHSDRSAVRHPKPFRVQPAGSSPRPLSARTSWRSATGRPANC